MAHAPDIGGILPATPARSGRSVLVVGLAGAGLSSHRQEFGGGYRGGCSLPAGSRTGEIGARAAGLEEGGSLQMGAGKAMEIRVQWQEMEGALSLCTALSILLGLTGRSVHV